MPAVVVGCMRLAEKDKDSMNRFIHTAIELGASFFDHADIYAGGAGREIGTIINPEIYAREISASAFRVCYTEISFF